MNKILLFSVMVISLGVNAQESLNMNLLYNWTTEGMPPSTAWGNVYNEVWGYAADNREYAIIGTSGGTHFIDVTNPVESEEIEFIPGYQTGPVVVHRDYHTMDNFLFMVCQEGASKLRIADMSYLPDSVHIIYDSYEFIKGSHNIFIDTVQARLYAVTVYQVNSSGVKGMIVLDISDPYAPVVLDELFVNEDVHDLYINDGLAYLNRGYSDGMEIWDFTELPGTQIGSITEYEGQGYNHSGYASEDGDYYIMADETHGSSLKMIDVSDPTDLEVISTMTSGVHNLSIAHNQIIHADKVYSAFYYDGIYIWGIEDPANPVLLGFYDTCDIPHRSSFEGAWGVYPFLPSGNILVSDMQTGLWVFELDETVSLESNAESNTVQVWPNPVTEVLNVTGTDFVQADYTVVNIQGTVVLKGYLHGNTGNTGIDVSGLVSGVYVLQLDAESTCINTRFVRK